MVTSTPIKPLLQKSQLQIQEIMPDIQDQSTVPLLEDETPSTLSNLCSNSSLTRDRATPEMRKKQLTRTLLQVESIPPNESDLTDRKMVKKMQDSSTNTENRARSLQCSHFLIEDIAPEIKREIRKRSSATTTRLTMRDILTTEDASAIVENALRVYKRSLVKDTSSKSTQCTPEPPKVPEKRNQVTQVTELFKMRSHVSVTAKPRTAEVGVEVRLNPNTRTVCVGPDPVATLQPVSLNSMNSRSHSFNYGDTRAKSKTNRSVAVMVDDLVKKVTRSTDTSGLAPRCREFGTSPLKKKLVDVSVGDSVRPHISISCAANYCDNCKETIKSLAKQITNNAENSLNHQNSSLVSRIPRPSHISLNSGDHKKQFKRQDTYTKIPAAGVIRYDTDNKEQYDSSNRLVSATPSLYLKKEISMISSWKIVYRRRRRRRLQNPFRISLLYKLTLVSHATLIILVVGFIPRAPLRIVNQRMTRLTRRKPEPPFRAICHFHLGVVPE